MKRKEEAESDPVIATRMPLAEVKAIKRLAKREDRPMGSMIRTLLREAMLARRDKREDEAA